MRCVLYFLSLQTEEEEGNGQAIPVSFCNSFFLTRVLLIFYIRVYSMSTLCTFKHCAYSV